MHRPCGMLSSAAVNNRRCRRRLWITNAPAALIPSSASPMLAPAQSGSAGKEGRRPAPARARPAPRQSAPARASSIKQWVTAKGVCAFGIVQRPIVYGTLAAKGCFDVKFWWEPCNWRNPGRSTHGCLPGYSSSERPKSSIRHYRILRRLNSGTSLKFHRLFGVRPFNAGIWRPYVPRATRNYKAGGGIFPLRGQA